MEKRKGLLKLCIGLSVIGIISSSASCTQMNDKSTEKDTSEVIVSEASCIDSSSDDILISESEESSIVDEEKSNEQGDMSEIEIDNKVQEDKEETKTEKSEIELEQEEIQKMFDEGDFSLVTPEFKELMDSYEAANYSLIEYHESNADTWLSVTDEEYSEFFDEYTEYFLRTDEVYEKIKDFLFSDDKTLADVMYYDLIMDRVEEAKDLYSEKFYAELE